MKIKMKNRPHKSDLNRTRSRHSKYKECLAMMKVLCVKQHLSNIRSSILEKVKLHWGWVEKTSAY